MFKEGPKSSRGTETDAKTVIGVSALNLETSNGAQDSPQEAKSDSRSAKMASKNAKIASKSSKMCSKRCQDGPREPKRAPRWSKGRPQGSPRCPMQNLEAQTMGKERLLKS